MNSEKKASVTITCSVADSGQLDMVADFAEVCQQSWEKLFGVEAPLYFNIDFGNNDIDA